MRNIIENLSALIREYPSRIGAIPKGDFYLKPSPEKWSKIEVLGHLVDSAQNNLRRFICVQYESAPPRIVYNQDAWVAVNGYQSSAQEDVVHLWRLLNERLIAVLELMEERHYNKPIDTGKERPQHHSVVFLAEDYVKHMKHHLNQIIPGVFS